MSYLEEWMGAIERSQRFGFRVTPHEIVYEHRYLNAQRQSEFPHIVAQGLGYLDYPDIVAQCLSINCLLLPVIEDWLNCPVLYTIGWIDDLTPRGMFKFDDAFIEAMLRNGPKTNTVNIHAWLTLPSTEIIDISLATTMGIVQKKPEMCGRVISMHADALREMAFKPMLIGTDFLEKSGLMKRWE